MSMHDVPRSFRPLDNSAWEASRDKVIDQMKAANDDAITFTADEREELGKIAHASAPHASPWDTMFAVAKEAYRVQGEAVGRRAIALMRERDRNVVG